jgi:hypothetical protein
MARPGHDDLATLIAMADTDEVVRLRLLRAIRDNRSWPRWGPLKQPSESDMYRLLQAQSHRADTGQMDNNWTRGPGNPGRVKLGISLFTIGLVLTLLSEHTIWAGALVVGFLLTLEGIDPIGRFKARGSAAAQRAYSVGVHWGGPAATPTATVAVSHNHDAGNRPPMTHAPLGEHLRFHHAVIPYGFRSTSDMQEAHAQLHGWASSSLEPPEWALARSRYRRPSQRW